MTYILERPEVGTPERTAWEVQTLATAQLTDDPVAANEAMGQLYAAHIDAATGFAYSLTRDPNTAEEAAQEAMVRLCSDGVRRITEQGGFKGYLFSTVRNVVVSTSRRSENRISAPYNPTELPEPCTDTPTSEESIVDRNLIRQKLGSLRNPDHVLAVVGKALGYSDKDIATKTGKTVNTVRGWRFRAISALAANAMNDQEDQIPRIRTETDRVIAAMPERYQIIYDALFHRDLTYAEAAKELDMPISSLRFHMSTIRSQLELHAIQHNR